MAQLTIRAIILVGLTQFHELVHLGLELNSGGSQRWETREGFIYHAGAGLEMERSTGQGTGAASKS